MKNKRPIDWTRLDNAAKIFPANTNEKDTKVFRISCKLKEKIDKDILQTALDNTVKRFPLYNSVLKRGVFWYYFEIMELDHMVVEEDRSPCSSLYIPSRNNHLFEVSYYNKKINLEVYHALTDGSGAMQFIKTLLHFYITIKHKDDFKDYLPIIKQDATIDQKGDDSFKKYSTKSTKKKKIKIKKAYKIPGRPSIDNRTHIIEGLMSSKSIIEQAHKYDASLTVYVIALFIQAIYMEMPERNLKQPVVLSVPVDLRGIFPSGSARNFFATINVSYDFSKNENSLEDIIKQVKICFKREISEVKLQDHLNRLTALERNVFARIAPLGIKDWVLKIANSINSRGITGAISNLGKITVAKELEDYIDHFGIYTSARRPQLCMCSYKDNLSISFVSPFENTDIQKNFFRTLSSQGEKITIRSNIKE